MPNKTSNGVKIIIGLGNPGKKYERTRHNAGFMVVDSLIGNWKPARPAGGLEIGNFQNNFNAKIWETKTDGKKVILVEPQTFMNNSGEAAAAIANFYKIDPDRNLLIIHDDVDLPFGEIRISESASSAGHKGVQNIIDALGAQNFSRLRIGVEGRENKKIPSTESFVLENFTESELSKLPEILKQASEEIKKFLAK